MLFPSLLISVLLFLFILKTTISLKLFLSLIEFIANNVNLYSLFLLNFYLIKNIILFKKELI